MSSDDAKLTLAEKPGIAKHVTRTGMYSFLQRDANGFSALAHIDTQRVWQLAKLFGILHYRRRIQRVSQRR